MPTDPRVPVMLTWSTGLSAPVFIIRKGDVHYVTVAVWEYDPDETGGDSGKDAAVLGIKNAFDGAADTNLVVREIPGGVPAGGGGDYTNGNLA